MTEEKKLLWKNRLILFAICFVVSFLLLMVCSSNSFLYAFNDWVDLNWFVTMGRGVASGKIMYLDLYEQKGPILFFVFAFLSLFPNVYLATFFLEVICGTFYLYFAYKLINKYLNKPLSLAASILLVFLTYISIFFVSGGGSVEEYFLPVITYLLLVFKEYFDDPVNNKLSLTRSAIIGILVALMFWTKYTMLFLVAILLISWAVVSFKNKDVKGTFIRIGLMAASFLGVTLITLIYFFANGAMGDLWTAYFYNNLFLYNKDGLLKIALKFMINNWWCLLLAIVAMGLIVWLFVWLFKKHRKIFIMALPVIIQAILILNGTNVYVYYYLEFMPYVAFILALALHKVPSIEKSKINAIIVAATFIVTFGLSFAFSNSRMEIGGKKSDYSQFVVAHEIKSFGLENPTLLCYKMQDLGFYNAAGIIPQDKYYALNNFERESFPELYESFENSVKQQKNDFIVVKKDVYNEEFEFLTEFYDYYGEYSYTQRDNYLLPKDFTFVLMVNKNINW